MSNKFVGGFDLPLVFVKSLLMLMTGLGRQRSGLVVFCSTVVVLTWVGIVPAQNVTKVERNTDGTRTTVLRTVTEIPAATELCSPEECDWWEQLRSAGDDLQKKGDKKSKRQFLSLLVEGMEKSYRVPLEDRSPLVLYSEKPNPLSSGVRSKNGKVELSLEYAAEGSIGEVKVLNGVRPDLDERCIGSMRGTLFLPAVKDRRFVTEWQSASCSFHSLSRGR